MKRIKLLTCCIFIGIFSIQAQDEAYLDIGNVKALINTNGVLFGDLNLYHASYEVPKGSNKFSIYSSSFWMMDKKVLNNKVIYSGAYELFGLDTIFNRGPVDIVNQKDDTSSVFQRVWSVYQADIDYHIQNWSDPSYTTPYSILSWPGNGNSNTAQNLAPYADLDKDNIYEPNDGEYPVIKGDQAVFFMLNDYRDPITFVDSNSHSSSVDTMIFQSANLEVHVMMYAYTFNQPANIYNSVFANVKMINRSSSGNGDLNDFRVSVATDFDIGNPQDDYVGTDTSRSMVYAYNGDNIDESVYGMFGYGNQLAAQAVKFLNSGLFSSTYYSNNPILTGPTEFSVNANYQRAIWADGSPYFYGGNGHYLDSCADINNTTNYILSGDPTKLGDTTQWTELNPCLGVNSIANTPGDRRIIGTADFPTQLLHGDTLVMDYAYVFALGDNNTTPKKDPVRELYIAAEEVQGFYDSMLVVGINENMPQEFKQTFNLFPNPSKHLVNLELEENDFEISIYDFNGRLVKELKNEKQFSVEELNNGIYLIQVAAEGSVMSKKLVVQH